MTAMAAIASIGYSGEVQNPIPKIMAIVSGSVIAMVERLPGLRFETWEADEVKVKGAAKECVAIAWEFLAAGEELRFDYDEYRPKNQGFWCNLENMGSTNMNDLALGWNRANNLSFGSSGPRWTPPLNSEFSAEFLPEGFEERVKEIKRGLLITCKIYPE